MNIPQKALALLLSLALALSLVSCAQGKVNEERLPGGTQGGSAPAGGAQEPTGGTHAPIGGGAQDPIDGWDPNDPYGFNNYVEIEGSTFEDTRANFPKGTVLYTVTGAGLYDSLEEAGISEESYAVLGEEPYDHYVKIDMTVKNVDISDTEDYTINSFGLMCRLYPLREVVWFNLGGVADEEPNHYFYYHLPPAGESVDVSLAWGLWDSELAELRDAGGIWLTYGLNIWQKMKLEGLL